MYGEEYPNVVFDNGIRLPLNRESRFIRYYHNHEHNVGAEISRFMDGTAEISFRELKELWPGWSPVERRDFISASHWLHEHPEFADMMRFVMDHGDQDDCSAVALQVAGALPRDEAYQRLTDVLEKSPIGKRANLTQGIAHTKHPEAAKCLREQLELILADPRIMKPDNFLNRVTYDAICCIAHLIEIGCSPEEFESEVRRLNQHPSKGTRDSLRPHLGKWFTWLKKT